MHDRNDEKGLSNEELIAALAAALQKEHTLVASVITMLMEVEDRRLHLELACPSMFEFCVRRLGMSEGEAYRRITVARLAARFPEVLDAVRSGRVHLSNLVLLRDLLTRDNATELLAAAAGKTKRAMQELVARLAPKPDVPALIRKLPSKSAAPHRCLRRRRRSLRRRRCRNLRASSHRARTRPAWPRNSPRSPNLDTRSRSRPLRSYARSSNARNP